MRERDALNVIAAFRSIFLSGLALLAGWMLSACQPVREPLEQVVIAPDEIQRFADEFFTKRMEELHIPGLVFIVVQGDEVLYAQGYGWADVESAAPMTPDASIVSIASVSKPFVATAVLQLVEQGLVDLHTDINTYLYSFEFESTFSKPVTLAHLLTHTSGIEDPPYIGNNDPAAVQPLGEFLEINLPPPSHPPGEVNSYSNYGYALAGFIVEEVAGMPFNQYVKANIFQPLQMTQSSYLLSPPLPATLATGYLYQDGVQVAQPREYDSDYPGGSIISTAEEMAHFIVVHLQGGCYKGECILSPESTTAMQVQQAQTDYEGQNVTYGFVEGFDNGVRLIGHSGATRGFGSSLNLFPEYGVGYFFCFNAWCYETSACQIIADFRQAFIERFIFSES